MILYRSNIWELVAYLKKGCSTVHHLQEPHYFHPLPQKYFSHTYNTGRQVSFSYCSLLSKRWPVPSFLIMRDTEERSHGAVGLKPAWQSRGTEPSVILTSYVFPMQDPIHEPCVHIQHLTLWNSNSTSSVLHWNVCIYEPLVVNSLSLDAPVC